MGRVHGIIYTFRLKAWSLCFFFFPSEGNHRLGHGHGPLFQKQITERTDVPRTVLDTYSTRKSITNVPFDALYQVHGTHRNYLDCSSCLVQQLGRFMSRRRMPRAINVDRLVMWVDEVFPFARLCLVYLTKLGRHTIANRQLRQLGSAPCQLGTHHRAIAFKCLGAPASAVRHHYS